MEYSRFMELPIQMKIQIINKCSPFTYVRLRRTCRYVDGFCEQNRKYLCVYCSHDYACIWLDYEHKKNYDCVQLRGFYNKNWIKIPLLPENIARINKSLSGFFFKELCLLKRNEKNYDSAVNYFLEAVPDFKVKRLEFREPTTEKVKGVLSSKWKIGILRFAYPIEMSSLLSIDAIRNRDGIGLAWCYNDDDYTEQEIVQLARGKKRIMIQANFLSTSSRLNVLKAIVQNWKNDGEYPRSFYTDWCNDQVCMDADISGFYSETMGMEALHLGSFLELGRYGFDWTTKYDIWIKMEENTKTWHFVKLMRDENNSGIITTEFRFKSGFSRSELCWKLIKFLNKVYYDFVFDYSPLYEAQNMEQFKEAFANIVPKLKE